MKNVNKTIMYNKMRKAFAERGFDQYDAAAHAMELVLNGTPTEAMNASIDKRTFAILESAKRAYRERL